MDGHLGCFPFGAIMNNVAIELHFIIFCFCFFFLQIEFLLEFEEIHCLVIFVINKLIGNPQVQQFILIMI